MKSSRTTKQIAEEISEQLRDTPLYARYMAGGDSDDFGTALVDVLDAIVELSDETSWAWIGSELGVGEYADESEEDRIRRNNKRKMKISNDWRTAKGCVLGDGMPSEDVIRSGRGDL